jgi:hypothetical protein
VSCVEESLWSLGKPAAADLENDEACVTLGNELRTKPPSLRTRRSSRTTVPATATKSDRGAEEGPPAAERRGSAR